MSFTLSNLRVIYNFINENADYAKQICLILNTKIFVHLLNP